VVWIAGDPASSKVLVAIPDTREMFPASYPRGRAGREWLNAQKGPSSKERVLVTMLYGILSLGIAVAALAAARHQNWWGALLLGAQASFFASIFVLTYRRRRQRRDSGPGV
jgi:hypothetical protein